MNVINHVREYESPEVSVIRISAETNICSPNKPSGLNGGESNLYDVEPED